MCWTWTATMSDDKRAGRHWWICLLSWLNNKSNYGFSIALLQMRLNYLFILRDTRQENVRSAKMSSFEFLQKYALPKSTQIECILLCFRIRIASYCCCVRSCTMSLFSILNYCMRRLEVHTYTLAIRSCTANTFTRSHTIRLARANDSWLGHTEFMYARLRNTQHESVSYAMALHTPSYELCGRMRCRDVGKNTKNIHEFSECVSSMLTGWKCCTCTATLHRFWFRLLFSSTFHSSGKWRMTALAPTENWFRRNLRTTRNGRVLSIWWTLSVSVFNIHTIWIWWYRTGVFGCDDTYLNGVCVECTAKSRLCSWAIQQKITIIQ